MWIFTSPKNYSEMLKKIATTTFFISLFIIMILSHTINDISSFMKIISFGLKYEYGGLKLYISYFYFPLLFALGENIFKIHDKVSDLFGIRYRFDKNIIIARFLNEIKQSKKLKKVNKINRDSIMRVIFYKYASSTNPQIDRHLIDMALGVWSWYWIIMDTLLCVITLGIIWLIFSFSWLACFVLIGIIITCLSIMHIIKKFQCSEYALQEVQAILQLQNSRSEIKRYLSDAL